MALTGKSATFVWMDEWGDRIETVYEDEANPCSEIVWRGGVFAEELRPTGTPILSIKAIPTEELFGVKPASVKLPLLKDWTNTLHHDDFADSSASMLEPNGPISRIMNIEETPRQTGKKWRSALEQMLSNKKGKGKPMTEEETLRKKIEEMAQQHREEKHGLRQQIIDLKGEVQRLQREVQSKVTQINCEQAEVERLNEEITALKRANDELKGIKYADVGSW